MCEVLTGYSVCEAIVIAVAYILCLSPSNWFIRLVLKSYNQLPDERDPNKVGRLIGLLERVLVLTFVLIGSMEAVGFLIAAKSILRFRDSQTERTEYVLAGTLLSFSIPILIGVIIQYFIF